MARIIVLIVVLVGLAGCASKPVEPIVRVETVEVKVPYPVMPDPPEWLAEPYSPGALPKFISPDDPAAAVALDAESVALLREIIRNYFEREIAWRDWAKSE